MNWWVNLDSRSLDCVCNKLHTLRAVRIRFILQQNTEGTKYIFGQVAIPKLRLRLPPNRQRAECVGVAWGKDETAELAER